MGSHTPETKSRGFVVLSPNAILPRRLPSPVIAVPQNILPFISSGPRPWVQRAAILRTLQFATGAVFVSEEMRRQVARFTKLPALQRVIHHGLGEPFRATVGNVKRDGIVLLADRNPHKRLDLLLTAWHRLGPSRPALRVVGAARSGSPLDAEVTFDPWLAPAAVANALRAARLAVVPSIAESFGLPALEALACETPLLVSDIPALREVTGGHAMYVDSDRGEVWADAIRATLATAPRTVAGREWALRFSWERSAAAMAALLIDAATIRPTPA